LSDYNALLKLHTSPAQINDVQKKLRLLKPKLESAQKRETDEMLNKLKGLGDSILGLSVSLLLMREDADAQQGILDYRPAISSLNPMAREDIQLILPSKPGAGRY